MGNGLSERRQTMKVQTMMQFAGTFRLRVCFLAADGCFHFNAHAMVCAQTNPMRFMPISQTKYFSRSKVTQIDRDAKSLIGEVPYLLSVHVLWTQHIHTHVQ